MSHRKRTFVSLNNEPQSQTPMAQIMIINGIEQTANDWKVRPLQREAGWAPQAEDAHNAEMAKMGMDVLKLGEASFTCDVELSVGDEFVLKADERRFKITSGFNKKFKAVFVPS